MLVIVSTSMCLGDSASASKLAAIARPPHITWYVCMIYLSGFIYSESGSFSQKIRKKKNIFFYILAS